MIATLSEIAQSIGEDGAQEVTLRTLELKPVRSMPGPVEATSVGEVWFRLLQAAEVKQPDRYVSRVHTRNRSNAGRRREAESTHLKRKWLGMPPPRRSAASRANGFARTNAPSAEPSARPAFDGGCSVLEEIERADDIRTLNKELGRLPPEDQDLIRRVYWEDRSQLEVARELGQTPSAIRSRVDRIRGRLAHELVARGADP